MILATHTFQIKMRGSNMHIVHTFSTELPPRAHGDGAGGIPARVPLFVRQCGAADKVCASFLSAREPYPQYSHSPHYHTPLNTHVCAVTLSVARYCWWEGPCSWGYRIPQLRLPARLPPSDLWVVYCGTRGHGSENERESGYRRLSGYGCGPWAWVWASAWAWAWGLAWAWAWTWS